MSKLTTLEDNYRRTCLHLFALLLILGCWVGVLLNEHRIASLERELNTKEAESEQRIAHAQSTADAAIALLIQQCLEMGKDDCKVTINGQ